MLFSRQTNGVKIQSIQYIFVPLHLSLFLSPSQFYVPFHVPRYIVGVRTQNKSHLFRPNKLKLVKIRYRIIFDKLLNYDDCQRVSSLDNSKCWFNSSNKSKHKTKANSPWDLQSGHDYSGTNKCRLTA